MELKYPNVTRFHPEYSMDPPSPIFDLLDKAKIAQILVHYLDNEINTLQGRIEAAKMQQQLLMKEYKLEMKR